MTSELEQVVEQYVKATDQGDHAALEATYSPDFSNIRVSDDGGRAEISGSQILYILKATAKTWRPRPARDTTIHHAEVSGEWGEVLVTRLRDLGQGWEPEFLTLIWRNIAGKWLLWREFVHQRRFAVLR